MGIKQLMGGGGIILLAQILIPKLNDLMSTS
ncbi:MAG: Maff2 family protein [Ruminococcus sp.]|nr:MAG: Maff2 family protein [Ruminococcus sp.]